MGARRERQKPRAFTAKESRGGGEGGGEEDIEPERTDMGRLTKYSVDSLATIVYSEDAQGQAQVLQVA